MLQKRVMYPSVDTPVVLVDLDKMEANIKEMAQVAAAAGVKLRPHIKTHKSPYIANLQLEAGASGITVAKVSEAEVMADAGIDDIYIAYPIYGELKLTRLKGLLEKAKIRVALDSIEVAQGLAGLGREVGQDIPVLLQVETGIKRCGTLPGQPTLEMARKLCRIEGIKLIGLHAHEGHAHAAAHGQGVEGFRRVAFEVGRTMVETAELLRKDGITIEEISVGATPTARYSAEVPGITELRPGTYVFNDRMILSDGLATEDTCAVTILATVVSRAAPDRAVVDAGSKTLSSDTLIGEKGYGHVIGRPDIIIDRLNEEHGMLALTDPRARLSIGDRLEIIPNHICPVMNLADVAYGVRNGEVEREIPILARGKNQ